MGPAGCVPSEQTSSGALPAPGKLDASSVVDMGPREGPGGAGGTLGYLILLLCYNLRVLLPTQADVGNFPFHVHRALGCSCQPQVYLRPQVYVET